MGHDDVRRFRKQAEADALFAESLAAEAATAAESAPGPGADQDGGNFGMCDAIWSDVPIGRRIPSYAKRLTMNTTASDIVGYVDHILNVRALSTQRNRRSIRPPAGQGERSPEERMGRSELFSSRSYPLQLRLP